ncbi:hypothetical protein AZA_54436 [Nitrospirillum viridazoti Y2]|nr:hypothetical protein AZA_54436 [Nitrospirillum amazonense Y2]
MPHGIGRKGGGRRYRCQMRESRRGNGGEGVCRTDVPGCISLNLANPIIAWEKAIFRPEYSRMCHHDPA